MSAAYLAVSGCAYDGPSDSLYALSADEACEDLSCPLAVGAETSVLVDYGRVDEIVVAPSDLADLTFDPDSNLLSIKPSYAGTGTLIVRAGGHDVMTRDIEAADVQSTTCLPRALYTVWDGALQVYPDGTDQLYASTMMRIVALHRDANGRSLLGHGIETWAIDGGSVRSAAIPASEELAQDRELLDPALTRDVIADGGSEIRVVARSQDPALVLRVLPQGSATMLALEGIGEQLGIGAGSELRPRLDVFDSDGRYIHGTPAGAVLEVDVGNSDVLAASPIVGRRAVFLRGVHPGTTTLSIRFDGREVVYPVRVR